jgi:transcriptional regulator with XRE-family HTH domain
MTQTELAERAGLHRSAVSKMEAVGYLPTLRTMATYADALDIELNLTLRKKAS